MSDVSLYVSRLYVVKYMQVACLALLTYDTMLTFEQEVEFIWSRKLNAPQILYFVSRYSPYIDITLDVYNYIAMHPDPDVCWTTDGISSVFYSIGIALSEIILMIRTSALYDRSSKFLYAFGTIWIVGTSVALWAISEYVKSMDFEPQPNPAVPGCNLAHASSIIFVCFAVLLIVESIIVCCTIWKGIMLIREARTSNLLRIFYTDSVMYYLAIFPFTVGNVVIALTAPTELFDLFVALTRVLHGMLCCRIILHLRAAGRVPAHSIGGTIFTEIRFRNLETQGTEERGESVLPEGEVALDQGRGFSVEIELVDVTNIT
ncbi:hypothetical protein DENSPDRAFT_173871 [Dentipellis sp. KUC8613]|nr:hypothetical protein DENSPDRAFT_173871 [Dentipellis sp. KUC8613]